MNTSISVNHLAAVDLEPMILVPLLDETSALAPGCGCGRLNGCGAGGDCLCGTENGCGD